MEISLCTDGRYHYVLGYGKYDRCITGAPVSILKKFLKADCFKLVELVNQEEEITPVIQVKEEYVHYIDLAANRTVKKSRGVSLYSLVLITRENELLNYFSKKWGIRLFKLLDLVEGLAQREQYSIGFNYDKIGIQLFIEDYEFWPRIKRFDGKELMYPFLIDEFNQDLLHLQCQVDDAWDEEEHG